LSLSPTHPHTHILSFPVPSISPASHIPRAIRIFQKQGAAPIPAPCDYLTAEQHRLWLWRSLPLPSPSGFTITQAALYEFLGLIYERRNHQ
jgi:uncharacterized SAM-binding protein YcdF (DUF218 family)